MTALALALLLSAAPRPDGFPPNVNRVTVTYLALTTPVGTTLPPTLLEYEVREVAETCATRQACKDRAKEIVRDGFQIGSIAVPAHRVQGAIVTTVAF